MSEPVTLTNCDREPIHIPGAIQPHGCLVVLRASDLVVEQLSANAGAFLGDQAVVSAPLDALFTADAVGAIRRAADAPTGLRERNPIGVRGRDGRTFHAMLHRPPAPEGALVLEPADPAHEALARLTAIRPDVVVSDIGLPGLDGLEMMRRLRRRPPEECGAVPACALTAYTRSRDRTASLLAGFQAHVSKPVDVEELVTVVASLVRRITPA